jgi:hypothetical protein
MILDEGCAERGCPMHDERETKGVEFIRKEWVGLTDEEMWEAVRPLCDHDQIATVLVEVSKDEYRAIETKLKEKNT